MISPFQDQSEAGRSTDTGHALRVIPVGIGLLLSAAAAAILTIRFRLKWWRGDKSAKIAISRFVLVPRG
jgi:hypothetical protein